MSTIALVLAATTLGVLGQLMLKHGMTQMGPLSLSLEVVPSIILRVATSPYVVGGLLIYGTGTFFWLITLSRLELSVAYPFSMLGQILIFLAGWLLLHEQVSPLRAAGVAVLCLGMLMIARS